MRTGFILDGNFRNDSRVTNEAGILSAHGHSVFVLNIPDIKAPFYEQITPSVSSVKLRYSKKVMNCLFAVENIIPLYDLLWYREIKGLIKKYKIEVLHAHDLYMSRAAGRAARSAGIPLILDLHENYPAAIREYRWANRFPARFIVNPSLWDRKEKTYFTYANRIIVLSPNFKKSLISKYPEIDPDAIFIYPNVPDAEKMLSYKINRDLYPEEKGFVLFYFGVISKRRGILTAIETLKKLLPEHPELHLLLIGPADKAEREFFLRLFKEDSVKDHITYFPWKDISEFPSYVSCADVCISPILKNPQHDSGVANKVFQYMLFKKPVLVSDCIPQLEIVEDAKCGLVFKNNDPDDMAVKLKQLMSDPEELVMMGERGQVAVLTRYNTKIQGEALIKVYNKPGSACSFRKNK